MTPAGVLADVAAREAVLDARAREPLAARGRHLVEEHQEATRLRGELVKRAAEDLVREAVGERDVVPRDLDVFEAPAVALDRFCLALMLMQATALAMQPP